MVCPVSQLPVQKLAPGSPAKLDGMRLFADRRNVLETRRVARAISTKSRQVGEIGQTETPSGKREE